MNQLFTLIAWAATIVIRYIISGAVVLVGWNWFVVPATHAVSITYGTAIGLSIFIVALTQVARRLPGSDNVKVEVQTMLAHWINMVVSIVLMAGVWYFSH